MFEFINQQRVSGLPQYNSAGAADDTASVITISAPGVNKRIAVIGVIFAYDADPTGGKITITDGTNTIEAEFDDTRLHELNTPFIAEPNTAVTITLAAGGSSVGGDVNSCHVKIV